MRLNNKRVKNKEWCNEQYVVLKKSLWQIREETGLGVNTIKRYFKKHGIKTRQDDSIVRNQKAHRLSNHPKWKGKKNNNGYIYVYMPEHPKAPKTGYISFHRYLIEQEIGRLLDNEEIVHHIDLNKENNNIENLFLCEDLSDHSKVHKNYNKLCRVLMEEGLVRFDRETKKYILKYKIAK